MPTERPVEKGIERGAVALDIVQYSHARVWQMKMSASIVRLSSANTACFQMLAFRTYRALTVGFTVEKKKKKCVCIVYSVGPNTTGHKRVSSRRRPTGGERGH